MLCFMTESKTGFVDLVCFCCLCQLSETDKERFCVRADEINCKSRMNRL